MTIIKFTEIINTFKYNNIDLKDEEISSLKSIFNQVDTYNDEIKEYDEQGDGWLNLKEYYLFKKLINNSKDLCDKFNKILDKGLIATKEQYNNLSIIYSQDEDIDLVFLSQLDDDEKKTLINGISITYDLSSYKSNYSKKIKYIFEMQFNMIKEKGGYTKDLEELLNGIFSSNENLTRQTRILDGIKTQANARLHILNKQQEQDIKEPNGKIDMDFKQGVACGDCWVLSSIKAIASDKEGLERLNKMITIQKENNELVSVTIQLQGKNYVISQEELYSAIEYSTGDLDVRAFEIAINRYCIEQGYGDITSMGGQAGQAMSILLDTPQEVKNIMNKKSWLFNLEYDFENRLRTEKVVGTIGGGIEGKYAIDVETGEKVEILTQHVYTIIPGDNEWAYLYNPHDTSRKLKIKIDDIRSIFCKGNLTDIN